MTKFFIVALRRTALALAAVATATFSFSASADTGETTLRINVRQAPDLNSAIVTTLSKGTTVDVVDYEGEFAKVATTDGSVGFLKSKYLTITVDKPAPKPAPVAAAPAPKPAPAPAAPPPQQVAQAPAPAPAAREDKPAVEEIVVTGSRIIRSDLSSISPITVLTSEDLAAAGNPTLEDFLQDLPSTLGGADFGSTVNNGNPGLATAQLRGLGPNRTLVLINGHRPAQASTDGIVDLNMIPTSIIERVEVLRDGASTIYGSDAVAGVINIITKKNVEGVHIGLSYDVTSEGDGEQRGLSATWGSSTERGSVVIGGQISQRKPIFQADRAFSACPLQDGANGPVCGGSPTTTPANIIGTTDAGNFVVDQTNGTVRPFDSERDAFNFAASSLMVTPQDVFSLYSSADYQFLEPGSFSSVDGYFEAGYTNRESNQLLADVGTFWAPAVPASNPFNPFGDAQCAGNPLCTAPQTVFIARRLEESNGRSFLQDAVSWRFVTGVRGEFDNGWRWDLSYNYADWTDTQRDGGRAVQPRITGLVDPNCDENTVCDPLPATQQAWDPFNSGTLTPEHLAYGTTSVNELNRARLRVTLLNLTGDFGGMSLPGGAPAWALGFEKRSEDAESLPDGGSAIGAIYATPGEITAGDYSVDEYYGEVSLPLLAGVPMAQALTLEGSFRSSDYDFVNDTETVFKLALDWAPIESLRLRVTSAEGFRAANLSERFLGQQQTAASYSEPCRNWGQSTNQVIRDNCGPNGDNLPQDFNLGTFQASTIEGGNPNLSPETSDSTTFGLVFTPSALPGFSLTLDFFNIEIENAIGTAGTGNVITRCYNSPNFSDPLCSLLQGPTLVGEGPSSLAPTRRNAQNQVTGILLTNQNLAAFETAGLDFQIDYGFDTAIGQIDLRMVGTMLDKYDYQPVIGGPVESLAGKFGIDPYNKNAVTAFPELAINTSVALSRNNWGGSITLRWFDETEDGFDGSACGLSCKADAATYLDVQGYYEIGDISFSGGVRNLTDEDPPYVTNYDDMNTLHYTYDTAGAYYYARLGFKF